MSTAVNALRTRREALIAGGALFALPSAWARAEPAEDRALHSAFPLQDPALVAETVGKSHFDFERVKALVSQRPELAKGAIDWGFGDWESAIGAASHVGRHNIVELLIDHGARPDLFTHAMMGHLDVVAAALEAQPSLALARGPHGISLLSHAKAGRGRAEHVTRYLEERGDADPSTVALSLTESQRDLYTGVYAAGTVRMSVDVRREALHVSVEGGAARRITPIEPRTFMPAGAEHVRLVFEFDGDTPAAMVVHNPDPSVRLLREE